MSRRLKRVALSEFGGESKLMKWLLENPEEIHDELGFAVHDLKREPSAGDFRVDIVGKDDEGGVVIIEAQTNKSDHDHLGKLVTYASAFAAKSAIWIVATLRPEHTRAVAWLNETSETSFYILKAEAFVGTGDPQPIPKLTLVLTPSKDSRAIGKVKREQAKSQHLYEEFWTSLLRRADGRIAMLRGRNRCGSNYFSLSTGWAPLHWGLYLAKHEASVDVYISDRKAKASGKSAKAIQASLLSARRSIESVTGKLVWENKPESRDRRIRKFIRIGGRDNRDKWPDVQDAMLAQLVRLERAFRPFIKKLHK